MINSISTIEQYKKNAFEDVTSKQTPSAYWIMPKNENPEQNNNEDSFIPKIKIITPEEARKTHNLRTIGLSVAGATVLTAGALFFVLKGGGSGKLVKYFEKSKLAIERKIQEAKLSSKEVSSTSNKINLLLLRIIDSALAKSEAVNNFTSLKDILFKRLMNLTPLGGKLHEKTTKLFERLGLKTIKTNYAENKYLMEEITKATNNSYFELLNHSDFNKIIEINGVKKTKVAWFKEIEKLNSEYLQSYNTNFSKEARRRRYYRYKKSAENLKAEFSTLKIFWSKDLFNKFIADSKIYEEKIAIQNLVKKGRKELSYSIRDFAKEADNTIMKMSEATNIKDIEKIGLLGNIRAKIIKYSKNPEKNSNLKDEIINDLNKLIENISKTEKDAKYDETTLQSLSSEAQKLLNNFEKFKQGKLEDILEIYKNILSPTEYAKIKNTYKKGINSLDKAIKTETDDFANKLRDLTLGSAPTDILSLVGGLTVLGYNLGKADNNDQRVSITLKYGIPAVSAIGVSLYCNAKMFAGTKAMVAATVSSFILNRIGSIADEFLKKYKSKKVENPPKTV